MRIEQSPAVKNSLKISRRALFGKQGISLLKQDRSLLKNKDDGAMSLLQLSKKFTYC